MRVTDSRIFKIHRTELVETGWIRFGNLRASPERHGWDISFGFSDLAVNSTVFRNCGRSSTEFCYKRSIYEWYSDTPIEHAVRDQCAFVGREAHRGLRLGPDNDNPRALCGKLGRGQNQSSGRRYKR